MELTAHRTQALRESDLALCGCRAEDSAYETPGA